MKKSFLLRSTLKQMSSNPLGTLFMCAGIMVGIAVLIAVMSLGRGTEARILDRVDRVGLADTFTIRTVPWGQGGGGLRDAHGGFLLGFDQILGLQDELTGIAAVLPTLNARATLEVETTVMDNVSVQGVAVGFQQVRDWNVQSGEFFSDAIIASSSPTAIVGPAVANWFFPSEDPLGRIIQIDGIELEVTGVLESRGMSGSGRNADEVVLVPQGVFTELFQPVGLSTLTVLVSDANHTEKLASDAKHYFESIYPGQEIFVRLPMSTARARDEMSNTLSLYLTAIAVIALLLGGTVMMNLTSLSISARTREIGLRKALGARKRDISRQVLLETMMTSLLAGVAGIALGYILGNELANRLELRTLMTWHAPVAGIAFAVLTGLVFGVRPANRAARLDPVVALRGASRQ